MNIDNENKYKNALERARNLYNCDKTSADVEIACEIIFPELKESEDGWSWNAETKELSQSKEIISEQILGNSAKTCKDRSNTAWSEKDEKMYRGLHNLIYATPYCNSRQEFSDWLEFLKDRVQQQPKQDWSEEDEERFKSCLKRLGTGCFVQRDTINTAWLESLKQRLQ